MPAGTFIDSVKDAGGNVITNLSLWGASTGTPAGTSMITVTATSGTLSHSATIALTVK
jgi:hypothetical protein